MVANATLRTRHCDVGEGQGLTTPKEPQTPRPPRPTGLVDALSLGRSPFFVPSAPFFPLSSTDVRVGNICARTPLQLNRFGAPRTEQSSCCPGVDGRVATGCLVSVAGGSWWGRMALGGREDVASRVRWICAFVRVDDFLTTDQLMTRKVVRTPRKRSYQC